MAAENNGNGKWSEDSPEFKSFQQLPKQVLFVPKEEVDEKRTEREREKRRR